MFRFLTLISIFFLCGCNSSTLSRGAPATEKAKPPVDDTSTLPMNNGSSFSGTQYLDQIVSVILPSLKQSLEELNVRNESWSCDPNGNSMISAYLQSLTEAQRTRCGTFLKSNINNLLQVLASKPDIEFVNDPIMVNRGGNMEPVTAAASASENKIKINVGQLMLVNPLELGLGAVLGHELIHLIKDPDDGEQRFGDDDSISEFDYSGGLGDLLTASGNFLILNAVARGFFALGGTSVDPNVVRGVENATLCSYIFTEFDTGWREHAWQASDCTNGLPNGDYLSIGEGSHGMGKGAQVQCSAEKGMHYNHPTLVGATTGVVRCLFVLPKPNDTSVTRCSFSFATSFTGWETHVWGSNDCSHGIPDDTYYAVANVQNGMGTGAAGVCQGRSGSSYNHPSINATSSVISCLYVKKSKNYAELNFVSNRCLASQPSVFTGWFAQDWTESSCDDGLPDSESMTLGTRFVGNGTPGIHSCSSSSGRIYNHPDFGATSGQLSCFFLKLK